MGFAVAAAGLASACSAEQSATGDTGRDEHPAGIVHFGQ